MSFLSLTMWGTVKSHGGSLEFDMLRLVWKHCAASRGTENYGCLIFGRLMILNRQYSCCTLYLRLSELHIESTQTWQTHCNMSLNFYGCAIYSRKNPAVCVAESHVANIHHNFLKQIIWFSIKWLKCYMGCRLKQLLTWLHLAFRSRNSDLFWA